MLRNFQHLPKLMIFHLWWILLLHHQRFSNPFNMGLILSNECNGARSPGGPGVPGSVTGRVRGENSPGRSHSKGISARSAARGRQCPARKGRGRQCPVGREVTTTRSHPRRSSENREAVALQSLRDGRADCSRETAESLRVYSTTRGRPTPQHHLPAHPSSPHGPRRLTEPQLTSPNCAAPAICIAPHRTARRLRPTKLMQNAKMHSARMRTAMAMPASTQNCGGKRRMRESSM